jgi:hypothetical protein
MPAVPSYGDQDFAGHEQSRRVALPRSGHIARCSERAWGLRQRIREVAGDYQQEWNNETALQCFVSRTQKSSNPVSPGKGFNGTQVYAF